MALKLISPVNSQGFFDFFLVPGDIAVFCYMERNKINDCTCIEKTLRILLGKSVLKPIGFRPQVDAVSKATMSSALIFHAVEKIGEDYFELQTAGYIKK